jgi:hypothetical protein
MRRIAQCIALAFFTLAGLTAAAASTETIDLDVRIRNGNSAQVNVKGGTITRIEVEVKRLNAKQQETQLTAEYSDGDSVDGGSRLQVDRQDYHRLVWNEDDGHEENRRITLTARNGDVQVNRVTVTYKKSAGQREIDVGEKIRSGDTYDVRVDAGRIKTITVKVKRLNAAATDTHLTASYSNGRKVDGGEKLQVDHITSHEISWEPDGEHREDRRITIEAHGGDVYVDWVRIEYAGD